MALRPQRASILFIAAALVAAAAAADVNRIVLRVNDRIATLFEFEQRRRQRVEEIQKADLSPQRRQRLLAEVGEQTMREMYEELLVLSRADQLEVRVSERDVDDAVEQAKASFNIDSDEQFRIALSSSGMTLEEFREQMRKNLLIREVMGREVQQKIELEEEDLRRYYRNHPEEFTTARRLRVREVVVSQGVAVDTAALAAEVRAALQAGEEGAARLAELAAEEGVSNVVELGWVERGDLETALEEAVWQLEPGAVSEPVAARGGLHVVEVVAIERPRLKEFAEVQEAIQRKLRSQRFQEQLAGFFEDLERSSYIDADPPPEAAGFRAAVVPDAAEELGGMVMPAPEAPDAEAPDAEADGGEADPGRGAGR